ncbi:MAG: tRNA uridine-5-carboxymethylaminomethyl(34) synthesis GTPase MnmE [Alphaproteobacteria bacterium]
MSSTETIFALATAPGRAGIAVFRISGPGARDVLRSVAGLTKLPLPRTTIRCRMVGPKSGDPLDDGLAIWFPGPASFTGEDVVELHTHGGRAVIEAIGGALAAIENFRLAEPGEFSKRAFLAGKIDLTEAEAIADLVDADTDAQRRQALAQLGGGLSERLEAWRAGLIDILAHTEAWIDFPDEDLPDHVEAAARACISGLASDIAGFLDDNRRGERLRDGLQVAILGAPNAGKSSLLNALAAREAAIVSDVAGTTRDVIEVHLDLGGWPVTLADTAGLRDAEDAVEQEGVRRALDRAEDADLCLVLFDATVPPDAPSLRLLDRSNALTVATKTDLCVGEDRRDAAPDALPVSAKTGDGLPQLLIRLEEAAAALMDVSGGPAPLTRLRHRTALVECVEALARASEARDSELVAEDLRLAARSLGRITGRVDIEDLLDVIFSDFCIGK